MSQSSPPFDPLLDTDQPQVEPTSEAKNAASDFEPKDQVKPVPKDNIQSIRNMMEGGVTWSRTALNDFTPEKIDELLDVQWPKDVSKEASQKAAAPEDDKGVETANTGLELDDMGFEVDDEDADVRLEEQVAAESSTEDMLKHPIDFYERLFTNLEVTKQALRKAAAIYDYLEVIIAGIAKRDGGYQQFDRFVSDWRAVIIQSFADNAINAAGSHLYQITDGGQLVTAFTWMGGFGPLMLLPVALQGDTVSVGYFETFIFFFSEVFRTNPWMLVYLTAVQKYGSLRNHRHLCAVSQIDSETYDDGAVVYSFIPAVSDSKVQAIADWDLNDPSTWDFDEIESDPTDTKMFNGLSHLPQHRKQYHKSKGKGVNHRVRQERKNSDYALWTHFFQFAFVPPEGVNKATWVAPTPVVHMLEHWLIGIFHSHIESEGGLNVNIVDRFCFEYKISAKAVRNLHRVLNRVCVEEPNTVLPSDADQKGWEFFLRPVFETVPFAAARMNFIARLKSINGQHGTKVDTSASSAVLNKHHRLRPVPASESFTGYFDHGKKGNRQAYHALTTSLVPSAAYRELERLRDNVARAKEWVVAQGDWEEE